MACAPTSCNVQVTFNRDVALPDHQGTQVEIWPMGSWVRARRKKHVGGLVKKRNYTQGTQVEIWPMGSWVRARRKKHVGGLVKKRNYTNSGKHSFTFIKERSQLGTGSWQRYRRGHVWFRRLWTFWTSGMHMFSSLVDRMHMKH